MKKVLYQFSYQETKDDVTSLMNETIEHGGSVSGGLGRAQVEYWLGPSELEETKPTPYALKLLAVVSIGSLRQQNNMGRGGLSSVAEWLLKNMRASDFSLIEPNSIDLLITDAAESFGKTTAAIIKQLAASKNA